MKYVIDRIENNIAILESLEDSSIINIDISKLPEDIKEQDILLKEETFTILKEETKNKKEEVNDLFESLIGDE